MKRLFALLVIGGLAYGIYNFYVRQLELLSYLSYRVVGVKILKSSLEFTNIMVNLEVTNNSEINVTITDYYFEVFINNIRIATLQNTTLNQRLNGFGNSSVFPLILQITNAQILNKSNLLTGIAETLGNTKFDIVGYYGIKKGIINISKLDVNETFILKEFL